MLDKKLLEVGNREGELLEYHAGDDWRPPGSIRGHQVGCQRVIGGRWVLLEDTAGQPGCRASAASWRNLSR